jgi:holdfast attachment protein HfaA
LDANSNLLKSGLLMRVTVAPSSVEFAMAVSPSRLRIALLVSAVLGMASAAEPAFAQTMTSSSASYNSGWGRTADEENQPINPSLRDANGNLQVINGIITNSSNQGLFSGGGVATSGSGASSSGSGAFASGATAIGNNLSVVTEGDYNTVIIDSRQTNNGTVTANSSTSGGVGNGN